MAIMAIIFGSTIGFFGAVFGWVMLDMTFLSSFGVYLVCSFGIAALGIIAQMRRDEDLTPAPQPQTVQ